MTCHNFSFLVVVLAEVSRCEYHANCTDADDETWSVMRCLDAACNYADVSVGEATLEGQPALFSSPQIDSPSVCSHDIGYRSDVVPGCGSLADAASVAAEDIVCRDNVHEGKDLLSSMHCEQVEVNEQCRVVSSAGWRTRSPDGISLTVDGSLAMLGHVLHPTFADCMSGRIV